MRRRVLAVCGVGLAGAALVVGLHDMVNLGGGNASAARTTPARLASVADLPIMRLTHRGWKTGAAHEVTIWFVVDGEVVYLTTMDRSRQSGYATSFTRRKSSCRSVRNASRGRSRR